MDKWRIYLICGMGQFIDYYYKGEDKITSPLEGLANDLEKIKGTKDRNPTNIRAKLYLYREIYPIINQPIGEQEQQKFRSLIGRT